MADDSSSDDDSLMNLKKKTLEKKRAKLAEAQARAASSSSSSSNGAAAKKRKADSTSSSSSSGGGGGGGGGAKKKLKKKKKKNVKIEDADVKSEAKSLKKLTETQLLDEAVRAYRWWDAAELKKQRDSSGNFFVPNWNTLEHRGVQFPPPTDRLPKNVHLWYDGNVVPLDADQEEIAVHYAKALGAQQLEQPDTAKIFNKNFFTAFKSYFPKTHILNQKGVDFTKLNFKKIRAHLDEERDRKKEASKEEKDKLKEQRALLARENGYALVDGRVEKVGNVTVEPPSLFRGRGKHPKMGRLKARIQPEEVTINVAHASAVPMCPIPGRSWKQIVHRPDVTWLAMWRLDLTNAVKYVYLNNASSFKGRSDRDKYEKARKLKKFIGKIRADYTKNMVKGTKAAKQLATAMWIIDVLALRVGGEKDSDEEADTVGCCSLRVEHFKFLDPEEPLTLELDFLGKDSMRFYEKLDFSKYADVGPRVYRNLQEFCKKKKPTQDVFDTLTPTILNKHLSSLMPGLTAKVFRTYNASITLQDQLPHTIEPGLSSVKQLKIYNTANREVSILCNHQRSIPKSFTESFAKLKKKAELLDRQVSELQKIGRQIKKNKTEGIKLKPELPADAAASQKRQVAHLFSRTPSLEQVAKRLKQWMKKRDAHKVHMQVKDENKAVSLTTAKINYMDPRVTVAWCKRNEVAIERIFPSTLRDKFNWAMSVPAEFVW